MNSSIKSEVKIGAGKFCIAALTAVVILALAGNIYAYSPEMRRGMIKGPWEISVHVGLEADGLSFPVKVANEDKPEKLDATLPVMGTPIQIILDQYIPDLQWVTSVVKKAGGGVVAELDVKGPNLDQQFWLDSSDLARQSMSSPIGGIKLKRLPEPKKAEGTLKELIKPKVAGLLTIWPADSNTPVGFVANPGQRIAVPKSDYKITVVEYVPHYQIDMKTRKVTSASKEPVNPALKVKINDGKKTQEEWLWSKFPSSPHQKIKLPFRLEFTDFDLGSTKGQYIIASAGKDKSWMLSRKDGKINIEKIDPEKSYLFTNEAYSFRVKNATANAAIKEEWKNGAESLLSPAIIATMKKGKTSEQVILQLNKPAHLEDGVVLLFRPLKKAGAVVPGGAGMKGKSE
ncbi:MAG: hypothetical protein ACYS8Z_06235 [Planctomycetota bacterium]|jgi:hypothetical protein